MGARLSGEQSANGVIDGSLQMNNAVTIGTFGRHISSTFNATDQTYVYNVNSLTTDDGSIETFYLEYQAKETRVITHGNYADSWVASKAYSAGDIVRPSTSNGYTYICTVGGASGSTAPTWPTTIGNTVTDNAATWKCFSVEDKSGAARTGAYPEAYGNYNTPATAGTEFSYNIVPSIDAVITKLYLRSALTSTISEGDSVRIRAYHADNHSDEAHKVYDTFVAVKAADLVPQGSDTFIEFSIPIENVEYYAGDTFHWRFNVVSTDSSHKFVPLGNADSSQPWRAVDRHKFNRRQIAPFYAFFAASSITAPAANATGVSLTPTFTIAKGTAGSGQLDFTASAYKFQIKKNESQQIVFASAEQATASYTLPTANKLSGATSYSVRGAIKTSLGVWLPYSSWVSFKTTVTKTITIDTSGVTSGDLVQLAVGESVYSSGYDFHLGGLVTTFPSAAYQSGSLQFKDSTGTALNFRTDAVTGSAPNRLATITIETNSQVITDGIIALSEQS